MDYALRMSKAKFHCEMHQDTVTNCTQTILNNDVIAKPIMSTIIILNKT